jgi:DNA-binding HxlR family transcriptional regulator
MKQPDPTIAASPPQGDAAALLIRDRRCTVAGTAEILGNWWTGVVVRECFYGVRTFDRFRAVLGLPRSTLAASLKGLVDHGLLRRVPLPERPGRHEYRLTAAGHAFYAVMMALLQFGDRWLAGGRPPLTLTHRPCGHAFTPYVACSHCFEEIHPAFTTSRDGPGAGRQAGDAHKRGRRSTDPLAFEGPRPCSVARTLQIIGDRWSLMILRAAFFGVKRFDELKRQLGIATNVLTDRLNRFVEVGIFYRNQYQAQPDRYDYRFTELGKGLFGPLIAMQHWGDHWLAGDQPPLILTHLSCGHDFHAEVCCDHCRQPLRAVDVDYAMHYDDPLDSRRGGGCHTPEKRLRVRS